MNWSWIPRNLDRVAELTVQHLWLALLPVLLGLIVALPLAWLATRARVIRTVLITVTGLLYTVPSLALIVMLPLVLGIGILNPLNVVVALTIYTVALLVRSIADALDAVPQAVVAAATAMGYTPLRRFVAVELPLAVPVTVAGLRVAAVSNMSLVTVGAIVGLGGLGALFTDGFQRDIPAEILTGIVLVLVLALLVDVALLAIGRAVTPWTRAGAGARA
ncbi:ABC transporter permease [Pseudonocardia hydrocarbonoxydans]|uniref:Glycine/betaine ABC transporter permease n=1 Tax=Pseudonocardia hydrocarbonoxydans TaxID=76726 RepID=A0A4Y3WPR8_9PSEU|nr:ABC transporter permease subunit [Pseudonocardia hydrocarbonoxydans]GEC19386.1 glycine/betaine ABC transporter permease [Pseudonocardia hydrocarbonoxydans]